jgi:glycosyltransferase involved in cell wall biosynthesis
MTVACVSMVKDEADLVTGFVRHMAAHVDFIVIADNGSTDGTRDILRALTEDFPLFVIDDPEVGYYQSRKMSALAGVAAQRGADWVVPADQDERWFPRTAGTLRRALNALPPEALIADAAVLDHVPTSLDGHDSDPVARMGYRRAEQLPLRKVAARALPGLTIHQGNHGASYEGVRHPLTVTGQLEVRHFPMRDAEQMIRKARNGGAAYAATDLPESAGAHWRQWNRLTDSQLREVFFTYYHSMDPQSDDGLIFDPAPVACPSAS